MNVKIYTHKVRATIDDDIIKFREYFKKLGLDLTLDIEETKVKKQDAFSLFEHIKLFTAPTTYQVVMYIYDRYAPNGEAKSWAFNYSKTLKTILLSTSIADDNVDFTFMNMIHEFTHCIFYMLADRQIYLQDPMDVSNFGNPPYTFNDQIDNPKSAHAVARLRLAPYYKLLDNKPMYKPKNFALKELVSKATLDKYGEQAWQFLDERMLRNLQSIREQLGKPITVNTFLLQQRCFDPAEERGPYSQHAHGRAVDFSVSGMTAQEVRNWLKTASLPEPNIWVEEDVGWIHMDVRVSEYKGVYFFKP